MESIPDLLIVGGGLIGLCIADEAARAGCSVQILERERVGSRASWAGAGMLTCRPWPRPPEGESDYHDLTQASIRLHEAWAARLLEETGIDAGFRRCGALDLIPPERATPDGLQNIQHLLEGCRSRGVRAYPVSTAEANALEPKVNFLGAAAILHFPDDAQVRNPRLSKALAQACRQRGVQISEGIDVADIWVENGKACGVLARDGARYPAANVIVCAGAWTGKFENLTRVLPRAAKIEPVRGQILCYQMRPGNCTRLITNEHHYLVPREDGILLVGSTMERVGFQAVTTPQGQDQLRQFAESLLPELEKLKPMQGWADLRPGLKGKHPLLGPVPKIEKLFIAAGHFRCGITLAPITAQILVAQIQGRPAPVKMEA